MVGGVLGFDRFDENVLLPGFFDLFRDNKIIRQRDVTLRFFGVGTEAELFNFFDGQPAHADDVKIKNSMFGHRMMTHLEDDIPVGLPGSFHFFPGGCPELIHRTGVSRYPGVRGRKCLGSYILSGWGFFLEVSKDFTVHVVAGENDFHRI